MRNLVAPWRTPTRLLRALGHVGLSFPIGIITTTLAITMISVSLGLIPAFLIGIPLLAVSLGVIHLLANIERSRVAAYDGTIVEDTVPPLTATGVFARLRERLQNRARWREVAYTALLVVPATLAFTVVVSAWTGAIGLLALPATINAYPDRIAHFYLFDVTRQWSWWPALVGLLGVVVIAPWITMWAADRLVRLARWLLGPGADDQLRAEVRRAESTRSAAVDAGEAERRRIERDLHDGAQQRLVALAADLGAARQRMDDDPSGARELVAAAHEEAKGALREIRDLVRGIHPVILEDRGLDAALSAVVARCPIPVTLDITVTERLPAVVESTAYFVISEALTNVARHSAATKAAVAVARAGDRLVVEIRDNGLGGADAALGTGLQGLRDRVTGLRGTMYVLSPPGGPTTITVELPCAS